ncbi:MAG: hypothetical protein OXH02_07010 [Gemmatimonadetes bacterium]|nr:hypothetical protein [Gemmatimonadota bacterium]
MRAGLLAELLPGLSAGQPVAASRPDPHQTNAASGFAFHRSQFFGQCAPVFPQFITRNVDVFSLHAGVQQGIGKFTSKTRVVGEYDPVRDRSRLQVFDPVIVGHPLLAIQAVGVVFDVTTATQAAHPGQDHTFQGHHGKALFVYEIYVGQQAVVFRGFLQPRIGNQDFITFWKSLQHNVFHADRQMRAVIRSEQQQGLQTSIQDTRVQAVGSVSFSAGCQADQDLPLGVHGLVDLTEGGTVLKPQFGGAFVESPVRDPAIATGPDGFQIDGFGQPGHAGSSGSHVRQPGRSRFLRFGFGGQGIPVLPAHDLDEVGTDFGQ